MRGITNTDFSKGGVVGSAIDLSDYGINNPYIANKDGYLMLNSANGVSDTGTVRVISENNVVVGYINCAHPTATMTFIHRGLKLATQNKTGTMVINFVPLE